MRFYVRTTRNTGVSLGVFALMCLLPILAAWWIIWVTGFLGVQVYILARWMWRGNGRRHKSGKAEFEKAWAEQASTHRGRNERD